MLLHPFFRLHPVAWTHGALLISCLWSGVVQAQEARIDAFGAAFNQPEVAAPSQTRIYAFRATEAISPSPINLYLNGRYHASLLRGGFTEFCLSPGRLTLQSALDDAGQLHLGKTLPGQALEVQGGRTMYLRVSEAAGRQTQMQVMPELQALPELRRTRRQQHTVSRAPEVQNCVVAVAEPAKPEPAKPQPMPRKNFTLAADALFAFGKATLLPSGEEAIETLAKQVVNEYGRIERISVTGYTDAIGPKELNEKLSLARARTVARLLDQYGLHPARGFSTEGKGSAELAKIGCKNKPTPENKACHAPNRRVVISVNDSEK